MRRYLVIAALLTLAVSIVAGVAYAQQWEIRGYFEQRFQNQRGRIQQGIRSGELTRSEADILLDNLNWMRDRFQRMKADGRLTVEEQARLDRMLDQNNEMIYNKKHNARRLERW